MARYQNTHIFSRLEKTQEYFASRCDRHSSYVGAPSDVRVFHSNGKSSKEIYLSSKREKINNRSAIEKVFGK